VQGAAVSALGRADQVFNELYTWRYNPLYHTGALVAASFLVLLATGLYLLLFYRIGAPYASVERMSEQVLTGRWIRTLHRYTSDLAVAAILLHALRMFAQDRAWGPRALAWTSGVILSAIFLVCGWTGYVMVWDVHAQVLAQAGARLFDFLPIFSEPIGRTFGGERPLPSAFFFLNYFAHIALPIGVALVLWVHLSRVARPSFLPARPLLWGTVGLFTALSLAWPAPLPPEADLLRLPTDVPLDVFYGFWIPLAARLPVGWAWVGALATLSTALAIPFLTRRARTAEAAPSWVDPRHCTGCEQCYHDCPWEAISMVRRGDGREGYVGFVDPARCVSCGICAGSCAPMVVGPPTRTGRDQLEHVKVFIAAAHPGVGDIVLIGCARSAAGWGKEEIAGARVLPVSCAGALHTSVIEYLVRAGAGVLVVACPPRDCWNREGVKWLEERVYHEREAELQARVDRRRLHLVYAARYEDAALAAEIDAFRARLGALGAAEAERSIDIDAECTLPPVSVAEEVGA
jgi:coenzyme F420-reducing hydrogenase delta subunit/Pyruvate/2-oxoacid:ferredoxin oxidoreductase delta subunit